MVVSSTIGSSMTGVSFFFEQDKKISNKKHRDVG
jgi:hypothetical protein